jgi:hypothetical protein
MKKSLIIAAFGMLCVGVFTSAKALTITVNVNGASGPWDVALNPSYDYGVFLNGEDSISLAPTVISSSSGFDFSAGNTLTITSLSPGQLTLLAGGAQRNVWSDANGVQWVNGDTALAPGYYIPGVNYLAQLVGTFAYNGVIVGTPFTIGNGPTAVVIPVGANQLLMGVNDGWYNDNGGSVNVSITGIAAVPEPCSTIILLGAALSGIVLIRRRS